MKRMIFVLYLCVAATVGFLDDITNRIADTLSMSKTEVQTCFNNTNVNLEDLARMDELMNEGVDTPVIRNSALKVGCLFACLLQKKELMVGSHIKIEKIKEELDIKARLSPEKSAIRNRILDHCINQVTNTSNECAAIVQMVTCVVEQINDYERRRG